MAEELELRFVDGSKKFYNKVKLEKYGLPPKVVCESSDKIEVKLDPRTFIKDDELVIVVGVWEIDKSWIP